ncbi:MAG: SET domain-containing protein-lysine N-methyltransferase [Parachlamydiaceae bacterium]|nr:SET domain-containing protein-lysine N-methyltransferase [Parachlamydiaceae bacterium]
MLKAINKWGFTALEWARLLGNEESPHTSKVVLPRYKRTVDLNPKQFQTTFGARYLRHSHFESEARLEEVLRNCPLLIKWLGTANREYARQYKKEIATGHVAEVIIRWIDDEIGYGLFADADLPEGAFVGEYTGVIRRIYRKAPDSNPYCMHYPTKWWSLKYFAIDSSTEGNELRFVNHSRSQANLQPLCAMERNLLHWIFVTTCEVNKGEQLFFDYGDAFRFVNRYN